MLDYKKVQDYIEKKNDVKLSSTQVQILKAIIRGDVIYTARGIGRSMLYDGYADYLKDNVGFDTDRTIKSSDGFDSIFTLNTFINDVAAQRWLYDIYGKDYLKMQEDINHEWFNKEFMCKFKD